MSSFNPIQSINWDVNRAERSRQVHWLAPLLRNPAGRTWFLEQLHFPGDLAQARSSEVYHLCFPLRDIFTADYYQCRGNSRMEEEFIAFYNALFDLPTDFGVQNVWKTAPGNEIRHPAAGGRAGWYKSFLRERVADPELYRRARDVGRMLRTEADVLLLTDDYVVLVELKYRSALSTEQHERHLMMGQTLARRLEKAFHFGLVVETERDPHFEKIKAPFVLWSEIVAQVEAMGL